MNSVQFTSIREYINSIPEYKIEFDQILENHSKQEILSLLGEAEPPKKLCEVLMDFIDAHDDLKRYWEEYINIDCRKQSEHLNNL